MVFPKKVLSVFSLVMINVIAVDSLRTLPISAKLGTALIFYYGLAAFAFFIPIALVSAELATAYPKNGGIYVWVREAFGKKYAFITIWLQWIYNIVWYPTILAFISTTLSYLILPELAHNKVYLVTANLVLFWLFTALNCFGMRISSFISTLGALFGTLLPILFIIGLALIWLYQAKPVAINIYHADMPQLLSKENLALFSVVLFGLIGMEMSAVHAEEVKNPQKDYPRALFYSTLIIFSTLVLGSLAIILVIPSQNLSLVTGFIEAFDIFFTQYHLPWMTKVIAIFVIIGSLSGVSAWIIGPTKGLLVAAKDGNLPRALAKVNSYHAPVRLLVVQGVIFSLLCVIFTLFSLDEAYLMLSILCAQLALIVYIFMFAAAIKLRIVRSHIYGSYRIPFNNKGIWLACSLGISCCILALISGFIPTDEIPKNHLWYFEGFLLTGIVLSITLPYKFIKNP